MTVILYNKYVSVIGGDNIFQRDFSTCSIIQTADGVQLQWSLFDTVNLYLASITTNLDGTALTYETITDMYNDYISKQQALSSGGGGATGWDTMLSQNQAQSQDQNINLAGNALYLNGGEIYFTDNEGNVNLWFSGSAQTTQLGNETNIFIDENAGSINVNAAMFGNIDVPWWINSAGDLQLPNTFFGNEGDGYFSNISWDVLGSLILPNINLYHDGSVTFANSAINNDGTLTIQENTYINADGNMALCNLYSGNYILKVDINGIQTIDAISGLGYMSPSWLLGEVIDGGVSLDTTKSIAVSIGGVQYNLALANGL